MIGPRRNGLWVALGGGLGALARFALGGWVSTWAHGGFPWGTFAVNLIGSAALGFVMRAFAAPAAAPHLRAFLAIGVCGGFTTFGTFDHETLALLREARFATAALYSFGSVAVCVAGVFAGMAAARALARRAPTR